MNKVRNFFFFKFWNKYVPYFSEAKIWGMFSDSVGSAVYVIKGR